MENTDALNNQMDGIGIHRLCLLITSTWQFKMTDLNVLAIRFGDFYDILSRLNIAHTYSL